MKDNAHGDSRGEQGQALVVFALMAVVLTAMVGLILDGGGTFVVRRDAQAAADLAALGGASDYLVTGNSGTAIFTATSIAATAGYRNGIANNTVAVTLTTTPALAVTVDIGTHHGNSFAQILPGQATWNVGVTASATAGVPDTASHPMPVQFSYRVFTGNGSIQSQYTQNGCATNPGRDTFGGCPFGEANGDVPTDAGDIAWTDFSYDKACLDNGNVDSATLKRILDGTLDILVSLPAGCYIGQHNNGNHSTLYDDAQQFLTGHDYAVPIVDDTGHFQGWATFHVTSAGGGSTKHVYGYFKGPFKNSDLSVNACAGASCPKYLGTYVVKLTN